MRHTRLNNNYSLFGKGSVDFLGCRNVRARKIEHLDMYLNILAGSFLTRSNHTKIKLRFFLLEKIGKIQTCAISLYCQLHFTP